MDSCYATKVHNCIESACAPNYECCTQTEDDKGNAIKKQTFGLCVKPGTCNKKTGLCKPTGKGGKITMENYTINTIEGYNDDDDDNKCDNWRNAFWVLILIFLILLLLGVGMMQNKSL